ncbi:MAG: hypothetical protein GEU83_19650 [Pseudonocardiaceae bacterium]|nr:hypothetical protein [Pseudonocardiaceae bacterium]
MTWLDKELERGNSSVEMVVLYSLLLLLVLIAVQAGLYLHAKQVVRTSAREGVHATAQYDGTAADGEARTRRYLRQLGDRLVTVDDVHAFRSATRADVMVTATVRGVLPWPGTTLRETSTAPVERFTPTRARP